MAVDRKIINDLDFQDAQKVKNALDGSDPQDYATVNQLPFGVPDPSGEPDDRWLKTSGGALVYTGAPGGVPTSRTLTAGAALTGGGDLTADRTFDVAVDGTTIEVSSDALRVKAGGIGANELASTAVTPATYGDSTHVPVFTVDADGRITGVTNTGITGAGTGITDPGGSNDDFLQRKAGGWTNRSVAQVKTDLGIPAAVPIGSSALVYRYTVAGSDKASIDTGVDTPNAGSNDWTNGDLLEISVIARTDDAVNAALTFSMIVNNDTSSIYDEQRVQGNNATPSAGNSLTAANWSTLVAHGTAGTSGSAGVTKIEIPGYAGTTFNKQGSGMTGVTDATAGNNFVRFMVLGYRSTSAISRIKITAAGATKFKVGTQLLIYKRTAS